MSSTVPLIFVGDICGQLPKAFIKLERVRQTMSTPRSEATVFICGDLLGNVPPVCKEYFTGSKSVPYHVYVLGPTTEEQSKLFNFASEEKSTLFSNVTCLGKSGVLTLAEGTTVAFVSGVESTESTPWTFNYHDIDELIKKCFLLQKVDILLTYQWPLGVEKSSRESMCHPRQSSKLIGHLVASIKPRMHFAANEQISFTSPYMVHKTDGTDYKVTTFAGLTSFTDYKNGKWVCGIQFPVVEPKVPITSCVELPFSKRLDTKMNEIFFDNNNLKRRASTSSTDYRKRPNVDLIIEPSDCWFCLSNANVDRSLIVALADYVYLTLAKGPLVNDHMIISPISHIDKIATVPAKVEIEIQLFMQSVTEFYHSKGKQTIWFERCYKSPHLQINILPIDPKLIVQQRLDESIRELSMKKKLNARKFNLQNVKNLRKNATSPHYFYLQIGTDKGYLIDIGPNDEFPVNFGRMVIATAMGVPERANWKQCIQDDESVGRALRVLNYEYRPYNFTLTHGGH